MVALLIIASFLPNMPETINGIICMTLMVIGIAAKAIKKRSVNALV